MKKRIISIVAVLTLTLALLTGCTEANRISQNLSQEADNFNIVRRITVVNCITGDVLFQMSGKMSITPDPAENQLEVLVESDGTYQKHFIGLSDNVTYVVEDLNLGKNDVSKYQYTINFNPSMWLPYDADIVD